MVIYELTCLFGHHFEGWFPNLEAFEKQRKIGLLTCGACGCREVSKLPSGGHIGKSSIKPVTTQLIPSGIDQPQPIPEKPQTHAAKTVNVDPVTLIKAISNYVEKNFTNVGGNFTDQAIQMHKGEVPPNPIYGNASEEQREQLEDEGVGYTLIPKLPEEFEN